MFREYGDMFREYGDRNPVPGQRIRGARAACDVRLRRGGARTHHAPAPAHEQKAPRCRALKLSPNAGH